MACLFVWFINCWALHRSLFLRCRHSWNIIKYREWHLLMLGIQLLMWSVSWKNQKSIAQVFNLVYWLIYFFHRKMFKMVLDSSGKDYRLLYNVVWICLKVRQILLISMSDGWKADFEKDRPTSHWCLAQLPKVQYLGKMVLVQFKVNLHFLYHRKTLN